MASWVACGGTRARSREGEGSATVEDNPPTVSYTPPASAGGAPPVGGRNADPTRSSAPTPPRGMRSWPVVSSCPRWGSELWGGGVQAWAPRQRGGGCLPGCARFHASWSENRSKKRLHHAAGRHKGLEAHECVLSSRLGWGDARVNGKKTGRQAQRPTARVCEGHNGSTGGRASPRSHAHRAGRRCPHHAAGECVHCNVHLLQWVDVRARVCHTASAKGAHVVARAHVRYECR